MATRTNGLKITGSNTLYRRHLISINDLSDQEICRIIQLAKQFKQESAPELLKNKITANCFYEPSTRTRLSFESAALRLGAKVIGFSDANTVSHKKGESLVDAMRVIEGYADLIVLRHPEEGSAKNVSEAVNIPVVNAGDGANQHPTQALLDLFTIRECYADSDNINIVFMGDLRYGRTVHSLVHALRILRARLYFVSDDSLALPESLLAFLQQKKIEYSLHKSLDEVIEVADILYMTRLQRERMTESYSQAPYRLTLNDLARAKPELKIMHPLPRVDEIDTVIDETKHAYYFQQAANGLYVRQAILALLLNETVKVPE
ncbi:MAG: aspartate carbamoyltransferase [Gammaproteobacteria bacterium]